jgi:two-component system response regulator MprA
MWEWDVILTVWRAKQTGPWDLARCGNQSASLPGSDQEISQDLMLIGPNSKTLRSALVFLVEDDFDLQVVMRETLELADYDVVSVSNPHEALDRLNSAPRLPRLIISDLMMPGMNGYQFFQAVRHEPSWKRIPFLFVTGQEATSFINDPVMGTIAYLSKPFRITDLLDMVERLLR